MTNDEEVNIEEDFEYNDGLGDLLREKERKEFSWIKTVVVLASVLTVIALSVVLVVRIGTRLIVTPTPTVAQKIKTPPQAKANIELEIPAEKQVAPAKDTHSDVEASRVQVDCAQNRHKQQHYRYAECCCRPPGICVVQSNASISHKSDGDEHPF